MNLTARYGARRERLAHSLAGGIAILQTAPEQVRNRDSHFPYRFDSYFHYLTGFPEPESVLVVIGGDAPKSVLFCRERDADREIWDGFRHGPERALATFGLDETHPIAALDDHLPKLLSDRPRIAYAAGADPVWDARVMGWLNRVRAEARTGVTAPNEIVDVRSFIDEMRLFKDDHELATMRRAAAISSEAHSRAMRMVRPGVHEYAVEAELLHAFRRAGAQAPAYTSIVAGGANACILHYVANDQPLHAGDLLLVDAGCELDGYASDITRTYPVDGTYSGPQRDVYELVLAAQAAAIAAVKPGASWNDPHDAAVRVLAQGFVALGLLEGDVGRVIESGDFRRFYMHRTGHWLGRDVHDVGDYRRHGEWRPLEPGMVLTVEPGCYIRAADGVPERFWNIGVRIEDDAVVTADGCEIITAAAPKSVADIEALMRAAR